MDAPGLFGGAEVVEGGPAHQPGVTLRCGSCGLVQPSPSASARGGLALLRRAISRLDGLIGVLLTLALVFILGIWVFAPLSLALQLLREGDFLRAGLVAALVATYSVLGARAALRGELGPAVAAVGLMILAGIVWLRWKR